MRDLVRKLKSERLECRRCLASGLTDALSSAATSIAPSRLDGDVPVAIAASQSLASATASDSAVPPAPLTELVDTVWLGGEGIGSLRVSPTGDLGQLYYLDQTLYYRFRSPAGDF